MRNNRIHTSSADRVFLCFNYTFLTLILICVLYPLIIIVSNSFSDPQAVISGKVWLLPVKPNIKGYAAVFSNQNILTGYMNTFLYTVCGTALAVFLTILAAYPLSRKDFFGRNVIMGLFTFTMLFSGGLIPSYIINRNLGFIDSRLSLIILGSMSVYNVIITRTFFRSAIPDELLEAAQIDGCDDFTFIRKMVLPLSTTIIAVLVLFYAVGYWNSYYTAIIYIRSPQKFPLQIILRNILILSQTADMMGDVQAQMQFQGMQDLIKYALIVVASAPILALYPFVQKYFVKGVMIGSLKG
ncbi:MAG: carbohydrate ABC transporter permease [Clostridiaceae bacterium]|nr:carbohydrate ABC transporter permease [Clostridiaceae bacterium]